jgi:hypothetical protein
LVGPYAIWFLAALVVVAPAWVLGVLFLGRSARRWRVVARLSIATLLGILLGAVLIVLVFASHVGFGMPEWRFGAPMPCALLLPPTLSVVLDARLRHSRRVLLRALGETVLIDAVLVGVIVLVILVILVILIAYHRPGASQVLFVAYLLAIPLPIAGAAAFTVGGLGDYAAPWARTALLAGVLAWVGMSATILTSAYAWYYVLSPCTSGALFCFSDALYTFYWLIFAMGLVGAPLGGLIGGLIGGALRTWVGRSVRAA